MSLVRYSHKKNTEFKNLIENLTVPIELLYYPKNYVIASIKFGREI